MPTLDLENLAPELVLPLYKLKARGKEYEYDLLEVGYRIRLLEGIEDPVKICAIVAKEFNLEFDPPLTVFEACLILSDFKEFAQSNEAPLKKVFGRSLFSDTTTDSTPQKSES